MNFIKNIFWNNQQLRFRAGYRLVVGIFLYLLIISGLAITLNQVSGYRYTSDAPLWFFIARATGQLCSVFLSIWIVGRFLDKRPFADFGFHFNKSWWTDFGFGFGLGGILMFLIFVGEINAGWITIVDTYHRINPELPFILPILVAFFVFSGVSFAEELLTRGYLLRNLAEGLNLKAIGPKAAIIIALLLSSAIFGLGHLGNPNATWVSTLNLMLAGILLAYGYLLTKELAIPLGIHLSWNFFQGNVFGFPVSGLLLPSQVVTFYKIEQAGPDLWTGGAFGPEAGLVGLSAMIIGIVLITGWVRLRSKTDKKGFQVSLAIYTEKNTINSD